MVVSDHYLKSIHAILFKLRGYTYWVSVQNWFAFSPPWPNFGPLLAIKWLKIVVFYHYLKKYSCNPIQSGCEHLLGDWSELVRFWVILVKFWPSGGHKITEKGGLWPISEKILLCGIMITQSISNMVFTLVRGVFTNRSHRPNLASLVTSSVFPFSLIRPQAGTCILWCLAHYDVHRFPPLVIAWPRWAKCGLVTPCDDIDLGQHWLRWWLGAW